MTKYTYLMLSSLAPVIWTNLSFAPGFTRKTKQIKLFEILWNRHVSNGWKISRKVIWLQFCKEYVIELGYSVVHII